MNVNDYRQLLDEEVARLRNGDSTPARANATANLVGKWLSTYKLQMEIARFAGKAIPDVSGFLPEPTQE